MDVDPITLDFCMTNYCFDSTEIYNSQQNIERNWIRASIIGIIFFNPPEHKVLRVNYCDSAVSVVH